MSQLVVRNVSPRIVRALKQRAARAGRSAEAEHRAILETALASGRAGRDFKAFLRAMPDPGPIRLRRSKDRGRPVEL
jgi:plasmid stability protein